MMNSLNQRELKSLLCYNPILGVAFWLVQKAHRNKVGGLAGYLDYSTGYWVITINGKRYYLHRLAFLYMIGKFPKKSVDHINGIRDDNRWENLREATKSQNAANGLKPSNNKSGFKGVFWDKSKKRWRAEIRENSKSHFLGTYKTAEEAALAYNKAAIKYFGEFARLNIIKD